MSLINDALKKAQKLRAQTEPPPPASAPTPPAPAEPAGPLTPAEPPATEAAPAAPAAPVPAPTPSPAANTVEPPRIKIQKRRQAVSANAVVMGVGIGLVGLLIAGAAAVYFLLPDTTPPEMVDRAARPAPVAAPVEATAEGAATSSAEIIMPNLLPPEPTPEPATAADVDATTPAMEADHEVVPNAPPVVEPIPLPPAAPDPRILAFLDAARVSGIRASATDPKVLMNDRVFRLDDVVDHGLGLRLTGITPEGLTFEDEAGAEYTKMFY